MHDARAGNLATNFHDITTILENWGAHYSTSTGLGDADSDGDVNFSDIESVLTNFNHACD